MSPRHGLDHRAPCTGDSQADGGVQASVFLSFAELRGDWPAERPGATIASVAIVSANRVGSARRALPSYLDNAREHDRDPEWLLFDDSADAGVRAAYRDMISVLGKEKGRRIRYTGLEEKRSYAQALVAGGLPPGPVEFCLFGREACGPTYGANLNARLLDQVGEAGFVADDDTFCPLGRVPESLPGLALSRGDPTEFRFHREVPAVLAALSALEPLAVDLLGLHEEVLGKPLRACGASRAGEAAGELDPGGADDRLLRAFSREEGRVAVSAMGIAGDSGMGSTRHYLTLDGPAWERLTADLAAWFALLPAMIGHEPPERRSMSPDELRRIPHPARAPELLLSFLAAFAERPRPAAGFAGNCRSLGSYLEDIGRLDAEGFREFASPFMMRERLGSLARLEGAFRQHGEDATEWAADVRACLDSLEAILDARSGADSPVDESARGLVSGFGELLLVWPDLLEAVAKLRHEGQRISRER